MKRLYFVVPDTDTGKAVIESLKVLGLLTNEIRVIAKDSTPLDDIDQAKVTDVGSDKSSLERGVAAGGAVGLLSGLAAMVLPGSGLLVAGATVAGSAIAGASLGALLSAWLSDDVANSSLQLFQEAIDKGQLLFIVDAPDTRVTDVSNAIMQHYADVRIGVVSI